MKRNNLKCLISSKLLLFLPVLLLMVSCKGRVEKKPEQLTITEYQQQAAASAAGIPADDTTAINRLVSSPSSVLLTGIDRVRLVTIYKVPPKADRNIEYYEGTTYSDYYYDDTPDEDFYRYFMPGMDIIYGYNLVNVGHYDIETERMSYFFDNPVLIRTLYFPGVKKDSLGKKPVSRDYFMVSAYDEDTNNDSVINKKDLRRLYHIDKLNTQKTQLIPADYSVVRSAYDYKNDIMYIYVRHDANKNGTPNHDEPIAVFWLKLSDPLNVRKMM